MLISTNSNVQWLHDEKIDKEAIRDEISPSNDYAELYQNSLKILCKMEQKFAEILGGNLGRNWSYDSTLDTTNPINIFEKEGAKMIAQSKTIAENNAIKKTWIDLLRQLWYERVTEEAKDIMTSRLYDIQEKAINDIIEDEKDGTINNQNNTNVNWVLKQWERVGKSIFYEKLYNENDFQVFIKKLDNRDLFIGTLNIHEGVGAFNECYAELISRIGTENIFDRIDSISEEWGPGNDQIKESLTISCITTLLIRNKIPDLEKRIISYRGKNQLLENIGNQVLSNEELKKWFLLHIDTLQSNPLFSGVAEKIKKHDPQITQAIYDREQSLSKIDIFTTKKVNGLLLFDNQGHGWWGDFYQSNVNKFKSQGYNIINQSSNADQQTVILQKWNDKITLVLLKTAEKYEDIIGEFKGEDYNFFALRGHCYCTDQMALYLGTHKMVQNGDIFIDGGCLNARNISQYKKAGIEGLMFAYTWEGKGACTEGFLDKIFEIKNKGGTFTDLMKFYQAKVGTDDKSPNGYFANNVVRADSVYYHYSINN